MIVGWYRQHWVPVRDFTQTDWPEAWTGGGGADNFARFLGKELLTRIQNVTHSMVVGSSKVIRLAGSSRSHASAVHPGLFRAYVVLSPSLDWDRVLLQSELHQVYGGQESFRLSCISHTAMPTSNRLPMTRRWDRRLRTLCRDGFRTISGIYQRSRIPALPSCRSSMDRARCTPVTVCPTMSCARQTTPSSKNTFGMLSKSLGWHIDVPETVIQHARLPCIGHRSGAGG